MHRFKFEEDDLFVNRLRTYPEYNVFIYQSAQYTNNFEPFSGSGGLTVFDINANRSGSSGHNPLIRPHITASLRKDIFKNQVYNPMVEEISSPGEHYNIRAYWNRMNGSALSSYPTAGTILTSDYGYASKIKRNLTAPEQLALQYWNIETGQLESGFRAGTFNVTASALYNSALKYTILSDHFDLSGSLLRSTDLVENGTINFITIPNMYYGSSIKKGSVSLKYYITGSKIAECNDQYENGILTEVTGNGVGKVVGLVMYDEGIIMLTASHNLETGPALDIEYDGATAIASSWLYYGTTLNDSIIPSDTLASASYDLDFKGINYVNSMTMFAHAKKGHLNHSNNPTYRDLTSTSNRQTGPGLTFAQGESSIKNIVSASFTSASFEKTTYISKINIYDENENLIGVASLANPVKKTIDREYLFKLKLDI